MFSLTPLPDRDPTPFLGMTYPRYRPLLRRAASDVRIVAIAATRDGQPAGLGLAEIRDGDRPAQIHSLYVAPHCRNRDLGTSLLEEVEQSLAARGCSRASLFYRSDKPTTPAFERVLAKRGWEPAETGMFHFRADVPRTPPPLWVRLRRVPPGFALFPWADLSPEDRRDMDARQARDPWMPRELIPWQWEAGCDSAVSLGLRHDGQVVGWLISRPTASGPLHLASGWVHAALQRAGPVPPFAALLVEGMRRAAQAGYAEVTFDVSCHQGPMSAFTQRCLARFIRTCAETRVTAKDLGPVNTASARCIRLA
jgi:GNAT superfamily N-acetyltransferase